MLVNLDCPVEMIDYELYQSKTSGQIYCSLTFNNLSHKVVKDLKVSIHCYDQFGDPVSEANNQLECKIEFKEGFKSNRKRTTDKKILLAEFQNIRKIEVEIFKILFDDKSVWSKEDALESERIELEKINKEYLMEFVQQREGEDAKYFTKEIGDRWICVCGRLNHLDQSRCRRCDRSKEHVLNEYKNEDIIIHNLRLFTEQLNEEKRKEEEIASQRAAIKKQHFRKKTVYFTCTVAALLIFGFLIWGIVTKFSFSTGRSAEPTSATSPIAEGIMDTSFASNGGTDKKGVFTIKYSQSGEIKSKVISDIPEPLVIDLDNNGVKEIIITNILPLPDLSNSQLPNWNNVYEFDITNGELVFASGKYPEYYKDYFIPELQKRSSESSDFSEKQALSAVIKIATGLINGDFIPDANEKEIARRVLAEISKNPLQIKKQGEAFYIHGITFGMKINDAIQVLGQPDESFEVNSKVAKWYMDDNLVLTAEYSIDTIHYIDLGEFNQAILKQSLNALGKSTTEELNEYSYITANQKLRFHDMPTPGSYRVQLMDPQSP